MLLNGIRENSDRHSAAARNLSSSSSTLPFSQKQRLSTLFPTTRTHSSKHCQKMWYRKQNTYHSLASNPEYADSESDDEKQLLPTERSRAYGAVNSSRNRWLLFTSAFLNVVLFGAFISGHLHLPSFHASPRWKGPWAGTAPEVWSEPYTHPLREAPEFGSLKQVVFEEDPKFMGDSPDVDAEWDKLWPRKYCCSRSLSEELG